MWQASEVANQASSVDWKLVAAAGATFIATLIISIAGWLQGKKKVASRIEAGDVNLTGAVLLDNQTLRESTLVQREVRDQLLLNSHAVNANCKAVEDNTSSMDDVLDELRKLRRELKERG